MQPLKKYRLGARFGERMWYTAHHSGQDYLPPSPGQNVNAYAVKDGQVIRSSYTPSCGNGVDIKLKDGIIARYCHLKVRYAVKGQTVKEGNGIGMIGNTGLSRGVHLHLAMWNSKGLIDPLKYLKKLKPIPRDTIKYYFGRIWHRLPAPGDWKYFWKRLNSEKWNRSRLISTMNYRYTVVYPNDKYSKKGDAKFQRAKAKIL